MKNQNRKLKESTKLNLCAILVIVICCLLLLWIATVWVEADENNTHTVTSIILNPKSKQSQRIAWVRFEFNNQTYYAEKHGDVTLIDTMKELSQNRTLVSITYPEHSGKNLDLFLHETGSQKAMTIVDATSGTVYYDDTVRHNAWMKSARITFIVVVLFVLCPVSIIFAFNLYVDFTCRSKSKKKPKEQRVRAQNAVLTPEQRQNRSQARRRNSKRK